MVVLGIHFGHGAAAALVVDGKAVAAIEEEKLNREKGYVGFPFRAIEYALEEGKIQRSDLDYLAIGLEDVAEFSYDFSHLTSNIFGRGGGALALGSKILNAAKCRLPAWDNRGALDWVFTQLLRSEMTLPVNRIVRVNHHLAHAASAAFACPWTESLVVTADGKGDGLCGSAYLASSGNLHCIDQLPQRFSVGQLYQAVTKFLGFRPNRHEGKITGLAAHGDPLTTSSILRELLDFSDSSGFVNSCYALPGFESDPIGYHERAAGTDDYISGRYVRSLNGELRKFAVVHQLYQNFMRDRLSEFSQEDIAAGVQQLAEESLVAYARKTLDNHLPGPVCLAGGVFANVKINQQIHEMEGVTGLYVQPAMDDAGCALGAALIVAKEKCSEFLSKPASTVYLGPGYTEEQIREALSEGGLTFSRPDDPEHAVATAIASGRIVGRFDGRLEWGPRALGNRSILADPRDPSINSVLNDRLQRTEFMPFAPAILAEFAPDYFVDYSESTDPASRYMTVTYDVRPEKRAEIGAVVHVDGTARPQVVFDTDNASLHRIIASYRELTGIPVLVNTSFNMHEEPIVNTPEDAVRAIKAGAVDVLSAGPFIAEQS